MQLLLILSQAETPSLLLAGLQSNIRDTQVYPEKIHSQLCKEELALCASFTHADLCIHTYH